MFSDYSSDCAVAREPVAVLALAFEVCAAVCAATLAERIGAHLRGVFSLLTVEVRQADGEVRVHYRERWGLSPSEARISRILLDAPSTGVSLRGFAAAALAGM